MATNEQHLIHFDDGEGAGPGFFLVRAGLHGAVGPTVSLERDGDVEVVLDPDTTWRLVEALRWRLAA